MGPERTRARLDVCLGREWLLREEHVKYHNNSTNNKILRTAVPVCVVSFILFIQYCLKTVNVYI